MQEKNLLDEDLDPEELSTTSDDPEHMRQRINQNVNTVMERLRAQI